MASILQDKAVTDFPIISLNNVSFNTDNITILNNINLSINHGEVHAIIGDHGTGKSSLGMILSGKTKPSSGKIKFYKNVLNKNTERSSRKIKIEMVFQDIFLIDNFTVAENLFIPDMVGNKFHFLRKRNFIKRAKDILDEFDIKIDPGSYIKDLKLAEKMIIYIIRSICRKPDLLVLDEPFERLPNPYLEKMTGILNGLRKEGSTILIFTHRIDDIYNLADRVSIIRNGEIILTDNINNIDRINLIRLCYAQMLQKESVEDNSKEFYQLIKYNEAILEKLPVNLIVTDNKNKIKMVNDHGKEYFNLKNVNYDNMLLDRIFPEENEKALILIDTKLTDKQEKVFYNVPINMGDINVIANIKILPIFDGAFLIGKIIIIEDISEQESLRQQVIISEKLASIGLLSAGIAHEINNPLEIIYNYLNYLRFNLDKDTINNTIGKIEDEITDIKDIIRNLISFSDTDKIANEEFNLNELIKDIIRLIKYIAKKKGIKIELNCESSLFYLKANKNEIKQVIINILKNSIEAMPKGGKIKIKTSNIEIDNNQYMHIIIRDNGHGIKENNPNDVFLPFYSTKKRNGENLGLGLSVSYGIVKKYNGDIFVRNLKDKGCEFTINLPY